MCGGRLRKKRGWEFSVERIWRGRATFKALFLTGTHFEPLHRQKHYNLKLVWQPCVCIFERLCEWLNRWLQKADWPAWQLWCQQPACGLFSFSNLPPSCKQHLLCSILCAYYVRHSKHGKQSAWIQHSKLCFYKFSTWRQKCNFLFFQHLPLGVTTADHLSPSFPRIFFY